MSLPNDSNQSNPILGSPNRQQKPADSIEGLLDDRLTSVYREAEKPENEDKMEIDDDDDGWVENSDLTTDLNAEVRRFIMSKYAPHLHDINLIKSRSGDHYDLGDVLALRDDKIAHNTRCLDMPRHLDVDALMPNNKAHPVHLMIEYSNGSRQWLGRDATDKNSMDVRATYNLSSQFPSITLRTPHRPELSFAASDSHVAVHITPENIAWVSGKDGNGVPNAFLHTGLALEKNDKQTLLRMKAMPAEAKKALQNHNGYALRIHLDTRVVLKTKGFTGNDLDRFATDAASNVGLDADTEFLHRDFLGFAAYAGAYITIVGRAPWKAAGRGKGKPEVSADEYKSILRRWYTYLRKIMTVNSLLGPMWWYKQENISKIPEVPRHLVTKFRWQEREVNGIKQYRNPEAVTWGSLNLPDVWPSSAVMLQVFRNGVMRQQAYQTEALTAMLQADEEVVLEAEFVRLSEDDKFYWIVGIYLADPEAFVDKSLPIPVADARITLRAANPRGIGTSTFRGSVAARNIREKQGAAFTCIMRCCEPLAGDFGGQDKKYHANLVAIDYKKPNWRHIVALDRLLRRPSGASSAIGADFFGMITGEENVQYNTDVLAHIMKDEAVQETFDAVLEAANPVLNEAQKKFAKSTSTSASGQELLHGPPGTGKTNTLVTTVLAHASAGIQVLYTSGQNTPVKDGLEKLKAALNHNKASKLQEHEVVYWDGSAARITNSKVLEARLKGKLKAHTPTLAAATGFTTDESDTDAEASQKELDEKEEATVEAELQSSLQALHRELDKQQGNEVDTQDNFGIKLSKRIEAYMSRPSDNYEFKLAQSYLWTKEYIEETKIKSEKKKHLKHLNMIEERLALWYLEHEVKVVFCTLSVSCDAWLVNGYKPKLLVIDEAAKAAMTDIIIPIAAFGSFPSSDENEDVEGSLLAVTLAGDDKQGKPINIGEHRNEFHVLMGMNLFEKLHTMETGNCGIHKLNVCYRMLPRILDWPAKKFYKDVGLIADPSIQTKDLPLQATLKAFNRSSFGKQWVGSPRVAFDVSGAGVNHYQFGGSTSRANVAEAQRTIAYVLDLLSIVPPADGRVITLEDIGVATCYTSQAVFLRTLADRHGLFDLKIVTADQAPGLEFNIFIVSHVISLKNKDYPGPTDNLPIKFIADPGRLCVLTTRAKFQLVLVGDFKCFVQARLSCHSDVMKNKHFSDLIKDISDNQHIIPQKAWHDRDVRHNDWTKNDFKDTEIDRELDLRRVAASNV